MDTPFYVWITSPQSDYFNSLTGLLLKRGFSVSPLGRSGIIAYADKPAHVIALSIQRSPKTKEEQNSYTANGVHDEVMNVIKVLNAKIFSIIVTKAVSCTWNTGNMSLEVMANEELKKKGFIN